MFVPRHIHQEEQVMLHGEIQQPAGRDVINAQQVRAEFAREHEIPRRLLPGSEGFARRIGRKRTVGDALEIKLFEPAAEEFSIHAHAGSGGNRFNHVAWTVVLQFLVTRISITDGPAQGKPDAGEITNFGMRRQSVAATARFRTRSEFGQQRVPKGGVALCLPPVQKATGIFRLRNGFCRFAWTLRGVRIPA